MIVELSVATAEGHARSTKLARAPEAEFQSSAPDATGRPGPLSATRGSGRVGSLCFCEGVAPCQ
jgi:hypothetical protein